MITILVCMLIAVLIRCRRSSIIIGLCLGIILSCVVGTVLPKSNSSWQSLNVIEDYRSEADGGPFSEPHFKLTIKIDDTHCDTLCLDQSDFSRTEDDSLTSKEKWESSYRTFASPEYWMFGLYRPMTGYRLTFPKCDWDFFCLPRYSPKS